MSDMEKPKAPEHRAAGDIEILYPEVRQGRWLHIRHDDGDCLPVWSVEEAEMLIHALSDWIEYKRQVELWEREHTL
jgi:hypothetical protein